MGYLITAVTFLIFGFWLGYFFLLKTKLKQLRSVFLKPVYERSKMILEERGDL